MGLDDKFVIKEVFEAYRVVNEMEHKRIMDALWGTRGDDSGHDTAGMVRDIQEIRDRLKHVWKIMGVIGGIISPIVTVNLLPSGALTWVQGQVRVGKLTRI